MKRYPEYKESDVAWIGKIPSHWRKSRLKYESLVPVQYGLNINSDLYVEQGIRLIRTTDITEDGELIDKGVYLEAESVEKIYLTQPNDFLISRSGTLGRTYLHQSDEKHTYGGYLVRFNFGCSVKSRFIFYFTRSQCFEYWITLNTVQATIGNVNGQKYSNLEIPVPSHEEQTQIVNFLDHKTGQIDELIRIKERQIELLREQRTTLINQAVTKGLDPNVEMKPSGVEWIGEIPKYWKMKQIKQIAQFIGGYSEFGSESYTDRGIPIFRIGDVAQCIKIEQVKRVPTQQIKRLKQNELCHGDTLIVMIGRRVGESTYYAFDYPSILSAQVAGLRAIKVDSKFLFYFIHSASFLNTITPLFFGATRDNISKTALMCVKLPFPPDGEQIQIVEFLDHKTKQIDELISMEQRKIELLKEYRQSLISEAVTGKIDVRSEV